MSKPHTSQQIPQFELSPNKTYKPTSEQHKARNVWILFPMYHCTGNVFIYNFYIFVALVPRLSESYQMCIVTY